MMARPGRNLICLTHLAGVHAKMGTWKEEKWHMARQISWGFQLRTEHRRKAPHLSLNNGLANAIASWRGGTWDKHER